MRPIPISGVYAIEGPAGIYVGESANCWHRSTLALAVALGLECGIVRELPGANRFMRMRAEAEVANLFKARGLHVVSFFMGEAHKKLRMVNAFDRNRVAAALGR